MNEKKILFLIPDGVGIRNYLYSNVIDELQQEKAAIAFWSPLPQEAFAEVEQVHKTNIEYKQIKIHPEGAKSRLTREAATYARLHYYKKKVANETLLTYWIPKKNNVKQRVLFPMAEKLGAWAVKDYDRILKLEQSSRKNWARHIIDDYKRDLKQLDPTCIFITHQREAGLMPICLAAKELDIPVVTAIYSWDNLPKARMNVVADYYIVWSEHMQEEMAVFYPEISKEKIVLTGTPQFEFYLQKDRLMSRSDFAQKYGLDEHKRWLCFSGDDFTSSPYDEQYLQDFAQALKDNQDLKTCQIIFRRCPADFSDRYDKAIEDNKDFIIPIDPEWHVGKKGWYSNFPKLSDVDLLVNMAYHCDVVVNVGSTMAHDFATFNKPCLYLNYNQQGKGDWSIKVCYKFQHFRSMEGLASVGWINSKEEFKEKIEAALSRPETVGKDRKKWLAKIVRQPMDESSRHIARLLTSLNKK